MQSNRLTTIQDIAQDIILAKSCLEKVHRKFNDINEKSGSELDRDEHRAWQAVVTAIDAITPIHDWAIDNC